MPKLLVFQHVGYEILGTLDPLLRGHGFRIRYVNFGREPEARPQLDGYHGLVVLGGPMNVDQVDEHPHLATEAAAIREAVEREIPVLGICLGAQLLAGALGADVSANPRKEIGWYDVSPTGEGRRDPLFRHFGDVEPIFQWHGDTFAIPAGAVRLAGSESCANQAFRYGDRCYGFQFHLEVDEPLIARWLRLPALRREIGDLHGDAGIEAIESDTRRHMRRLRALSEPVFLGFVKLFGNLRRRHEHPHG